MQNWKGWRRLWNEARAVSISLANFSLNEADLCVLYARRFGWMMIEHAISKGRVVASDSRWSLRDVMDVIAMAGDGKPRSHTLSTCNCKGWTGFQYWSWASIPCHQCHSEAYWISTLKLFIYIYSESDTEKQWAERSRLVFISLPHLFYLSWHTALTDDAGASLSILFPFYCLHCSICAPKIG